MPEDACKWVRMEALTYTMNTYELAHFTPENTTFLIV